MQITGSKKSSTKPTVLTRNVPMSLTRERLTLFDDSADHFHGRAIKL